MRFSPESSPNWERQEILDKAYRKAELLSSQHEIKPESFIDLYTKDAVEADIEYVKKMDQAFEINNTEVDKQHLVVAKILEAIIFEQGEQSDWFGPNATTIKTSPYDDYKNKLDSIIEFSEGENRASHVAFGIDVTYASSAHNKFQYIKDRIDKGELARIKYFVSDRISFRGELSQIPLTVISTHYDTINQMAADWITADKKALAEHWIQFQILEELMEQCRLFSAYAQKVNQSRISQSYSNLQKIIDKVLTDKKLTLRDPEIRDNNFYSSLQTLESILTTN